MQCDRCGEQLVEIDRRGERLTGCIECNRWRSNRTVFIIHLSVEDFEALRGSEVNGRQARGVTLRPLPRGMSPDPRSGAKLAAQPIDGPDDNVGSAPSPDVRF
jgi:hypothetical protein